MYGTVARIKIKPGTFDKLMAANEDMSRATSGDGVAVMLFRTNEDPDQLYLVAVFNDEESYYANADLPETNASFEKMAQYFAEEPQWHDGEVVYYQQYQRAG